MLCFDVKADLSQCSINCRACSNLDTTNQNRPVKDSGTVECEWYLTQPPRVCSMGLTTLMKYESQEGRVERIHEFGVVAIMVSDHPN